jgi:hypothetical protein
MAGHQAFIKLKNLPRYMPRNFAHTTTAPCRLRGFNPAARARVSDDRYARANVASIISLWGPAFVCVSGVCD